MKTGLNLGSSLPNPENYLLDQTFGRFLILNSPPLVKIFWSQINHDFVVKTLDYNYDRFNSSVGRLGALAAINDPKRTLYRIYRSFYHHSSTTKIPAREIKVLLIPTILK